MEQPLDFDLPAHSKKIYRDNTVWLAAFLGGPLVGGYCLAENFKTFNNSKAVVYTWLGTALVTALSLITAFLPVTKDIPGYLFSFLYMAIASSVVRGYQTQHIKEHMQAGGPVYKGWHIAGIILLGGIAMLALVFALVFIFDPVISE